MASAPAPTTEPEGASAASSAPAASAAAPTAPAAPAGAFPPRSFSPPHERTAAPGDGTWKPVAEVGGGDDAPMVRTVVHPHAIRRDIEVTLVAIDLARVSLHLVAGAGEPDEKGVKGTGLVPTADQGALLAVFNGGFKARHGGYGMMVDGTRVLPPKESSCTVAIYRDGTVKVAPWTKLASTEGSMASFRQTPPCLVDGGEVHPELKTETMSRTWATAEDGRVDVRRSALGLDGSGRALVYAMAEWSTPKNLADALRVAGVVSAAELDINWSYTKFLFFGRPTPEAELEVTSTLVPQTKHARKGYVSRPAERDFFYLKRIKPVPRLSRRLRCQRPRTSSK